MTVDRHFLAWPTLCSRSERITMSKPVKAWCLASGKILLVWTTESTRKACIRSALKLASTPFVDVTWVDLKSKGYRCVKVTIQEVEK